MLVAADPERPIRVALVGCGRWGSVIGQTLSAMPAFELSWVCDPVVRRAGSDWAPALDARVCGAVDAVVVATPPEAHLSPTLCALRAQKPVLVEKPFVQSLAEVRHVRALIGTTPLLVGHLLAYHEGYRALAHWATQRTGRVTIEVVRHSPVRGSHRRCPWWTLAPHDLALLTRWFGEPEAVRVAPSGEGVHARLVWPAVTATLAYSTCAPTKTRRWRLSRESSTAEFDEVAEVLSVSGTTAQHQSFVGVNPLQMELAHFADCVRHGAPALTNIDEAERSVRLLCAGARQLVERRGRGALAWRGDDALGNP